jgi:oxygen-independent coproporphyrinogen-3 oxidase
VTRVSIGVQSLDEGALRLLGRPHDRAAALAAIRMAVAAELDVSADVICGVPGVTPEAWTATLQEVVDSGVQHVSVYPLTIEPETPMAEMIAEGRVPAVDEDASSEAMVAAAAYLASRGLARYEVANYARPGRESRHNTAYWTGRPYLGIGGGAHGMLTADQARAAGLADAADAGGARVRYSYAPRPLPSRSLRELATVESLTTGEAAREDAMLGMRMTEGISGELAERAGVLGALSSLERDGLVARERGRWRPTERGWLLGNEVFGRIWNAAE